MNKYVQNKGVWVLLHLVMLIGLWLILFREYTPTYIFAYLFEQINSLLTFIPVDGFENAPFALS